MASCSTIASVVMSMGRRELGPYIEQYLELLLRGLRA